MSGSSSCRCTRPGEAPRRWSGCRSTTTSSGPAAGPAASSASRPAPTACQNLDDALLGRHLRPQRARLRRDHGAAPGTPTGRVAEWFTNYGSRMDVHAWGSSIVTTGYGDLYNGGDPADSLHRAASAAPPAPRRWSSGSALCLQGIARAHLGTPLDAGRAARPSCTTRACRTWIRPRRSARGPTWARPSTQLLNGTGVAETPLGGLRITGMPNPFRAGTELRFVQPGPARPSSRSSMRRGAWPAAWPWARARPASGAWPGTAATARAASCPAASTSSPGRGRRGAAGPPGQAALGPPPTEERLGLEKARGMCELIPCAFSIAR